MAPAKINSCLESDRWTKQVVPFDQGLETSRKTSDGRALQNGETNNCGINHSVLGSLGSMVIRSIDRAGKSDGGGISLGGGSGDLLRSRNPSVSAKEYLKSGSRACNSDSSSSAGNLTK